MDVPTCPPTPVKVINSTVLSCIDDMFYRLTFPNSTDLETLIKDAKCEASMMEFRHGLKQELEGTDAIRDSETGWDKYWRETQPQKATAAEGQQLMSFQDRNRATTPYSDREEGGGQG
jgi:hypothetical protein